LKNNLFSNIKKTWLNIKNNRLIRNAGAYVSGSFLQRAADFILIPLWAAFLTPEDYAITGTMYAYRGMLLTVLVMGLNSALTRQYFDHLDDPQEQKRYVSSVYLFQLLVAGILIFSMDHWGFPIWMRLTGNKTAFDPFVRLMLWMTFTSAATQIPLALYQAQQKARQYVTILYGVFFLRIITMVILVVVFPLGAYGQLLADVIAGGIVSVLTLIIVAKNWFTLNFSWKYVREGLSFGLPLIPFLLALWVLEGADRMILEQLVSRTELGLYNFGYKVGSAVQYLVMGIFQAFTPYYFRIMLKGEGVEKKIEKFFVAFFGITAILSLAGALFAGEILHILMPDSYAGAEMYAIPVVYRGVLRGVWLFARLPL
jgi:O-antigen/teichoic acid export membrane protein